MLLHTGLFVIGTVNDVRRQFVEQWQRLPAEYVMFIQPLDSGVEEHETFMTHVKPDLYAITDRSQAAMPLGA
jgi:hypothetical protein